VTIPLSSVGDHDWISKSKLWFYFTAHCRMAAYNWPRVDLILHTACSYLKKLLLYIIIVCVKHILKLIKIPN